MRVEQSTEIQMPFPITFTPPHDVDVAAIVKDSGIWCSDRTRNALWLGDTWSLLADNKRPTKRPYFLYPLSAEHIIDMMWGRLGVFVIVNLGKVVEALEGAGFRVEIPEDAAQLSQFALRICKSIKLSDGSQLEVCFENLHQIGDKLLCDFLSLPGFIKIIEHTI